MRNTEDVFTIIEFDHPDMTPELAEILSTQKVRLDYRIETDLVINEDE